MLLFLLHLHRLLLQTSQRSPCPKVGSSIIRRLCHRNVGSVIIIRLPACTPPRRRATLCHSTALSLCLCRAGGRPSTARQCLYLLAWLLAYVRACLLACAKRAGAGHPSSMLAPPTRPCASTSRSRILPPNSQNGRFPGEVCHPPPRGVSPFIFLLLLLPCVAVNVPGCSRPGSTGQ